MKNSKKKIFTFGFLLSVLVLSSCASREKVVYLMDVDNHQTQTTTSYEPILQPDDLLSIIVNSERPELANDFNSRLVGFQSSDESAGTGNRLQTYLIDKNGFIVFPVIGEIKIGGLTRPQAINTLTELIKPHIADATINMRILNFKVSVQGEVARPGTHNINSERITLLQALSMSGDLTIYGRRDNILIIREKEGKITSNRVNITSPDFMSSEFYYLAPNDVVYVEPNKTKVNSSAVGPNISVILSALSVLTSVISVIVVISR
ncbi:MAG: polysaccharide biosynthesis/export family protein [Flavobacteriaceae bacterium]